MKRMSTQPIVAPSKTDDFMPLHGIDHVEFYVGNALQAASYWVRALDRSSATICRSISSIDVIVAPQAQRIGIEDSARQENH